MALSLGSHRLAVSQRRMFLEPGLSSPDSHRARPSDRLASRKLATLFPYFNNMIEGNENQMSGHYCRIFLWELFITVTVAVALPLEADDQLLAANTDPVEERRQTVRKLVAHAKAWQGAEHARSLWQFANSLAGYAVLAALAVVAFNGGHYGLQAALMVVAAGFLIRLFIVQHDCGHGSFFNKRLYNNALGRFISVLTFTPYDFWRKSHNLHHAHSGNLELRGLGGVDTLTVAEYQALPVRKKLAYRLLRNPALLLLFTAPLNIMLFQRFPAPHSMPWLDNYDSISHKDSLPSIMGLNVALFAVYGAVAYLIGWQPVVFALLPIVYITAILGGWLFYIQHQFEHTMWKHNEEWSFAEAALYGSSQYILPPVLQWFSGNIGLHHLHHLNAKIPNYRLQACVDASPELKAMNRLTLRESFRCLKWALWDEHQQKLVSFADVKA